MSDMLDEHSHSGSFEQDDDDDDTDTREDQRTHHRTVCTRFPLLYCVSLLFSYM
jgi:hypothetical protein